VADERELAPEEVELAAAEVVLAAAAGCLRSVSQPMLMLSTSRLCRTLRLAYKTGPILEVTKREAPRIKFDSRSVVRTI